MRSVFEITDRDQSINRVPLRGSTYQIKQDIQTYDQNGLNYLVIEPRGHDVRQLQIQLSRFMKEIVQDIEI